ncbi:hypothetical protein [Dehalobacterium formicoaceticum]|uniref:hypothetical protein n=1 Tax=Dehalobacterium formicoaceticum TaxID=51515 RepID=UPI000B7F7660|nr:hypothetical protein [Dehalobacterium formicoaceticum]
MNIDPKINEQAAAVERIHFVKTDRKLNPKKTNPFLYLPGKIPILISAPHSVRHLRHKQIKSSDEFTGSLVYLLQQVTDCHALSVTKFYGGDPNFDDPCIYKDTIKDIARKHKIKMVLDIHGAKREHDFDIDLGTMQGKSLLGREQICVWFKNKLLEEGLTAISSNFFTVVQQNTVTRFVAEKLKIPSMQLEINRKYRSPHQNGSDYFLLFRALAQAIILLDDQLI